ncbi:helix-turn-helix domain-containing protein [Haloechinothrix sp. LS1_15]|uniref:PucR family transcriptional regulator n=1 Tax=Haloechinothrix sp. LS1_15 TaxID=2652248 RepID=UPI002945E6F9|nr:helix-turn-helix domain-containing protein [Haloechinothrix sp. LS1_15]MDV6012252.1 PucR family transcriptional regulator [Haloechinothrix sp. LS1_15]
MDPEAGLRTVLARVREEVGELSGDVVACIVREVPRLRSLPEGVLHDEVRRSVADSVSMVLGSLVDGREVDSDLLAEPMRTMMARVSVRPSFADILDGYLIGARETWRRIVSYCGSEHAPWLVALVDPLARQNRRLFVAVAQAYLDEQHRAHGEAGEARRELTAALLAGEPVTDLEQRAGVTAADSYAILSWRAEGASGTVGDAAAQLLRRRRVRAALEERFRATVLSVLGERDGTALIPAMGDEGAERTSAMRAFVTEVSEITGTTVTAAASLAGTRQAVPSAVDEAREVLDVVGRLGREPGVYKLDDVLLEVQVARPGVARDRLARRLDPLCERPELLGTLRTLFDAKLNRRRAARALHVHPNTLDYRLQRVAEFVGLDPGDPDELRVLATALIAYDLERGEC